MTLVRGRISKQKDTSVHAFLSNVVAIQLHSSPIPGNDDDLNCYNTPVSPIVESIPPIYDDIVSASSRIAPWAHRTPVLTSRLVDEASGVKIFFKCENLQRGGAFKFRGAMNALLQLDEDQRQRGVVAFSSGNHAQGVALAAQLLGIRATIVMPEGSNPNKVEATKNYGATVIQAGVTEVTRGDAASRVAKETGATVIPPFDDSRIIAGAGTVGLEILQQAPDIRSIMVPLGGGGLLAGIALAVRTIRPDVEVYGVEPAAGNDGEQSFRAGTIVRIDPPQTIADGARTTAIGVRNFALIRHLVHDVVSVPDDTLLEAMKFVIYRTKLLIEPTGALGIAAILGGVVRPQGPVAVVLSGGNIDFSVLTSGRA